MEDAGVTAFRQHPHGESRTGFLSMVSQVQLGTNGRLILVAVLLCAASFVAAAAGVGGGGIFMPLLVAVSGLTAKEAVPLAQAMIFGGSIINYIFFVGQYHPNSPKEGPPISKIDYDGVVLLEPTLCVGVTFGVLIHHAMPDWFLICLLCATLIPAVSKTGKKAFQQHRQEAAARARGDPVVLPPGGGMSDAANNVGRNLKAIFGIIVIWGFVLLTLMFVPHLGVCSIGGVILLASLVCVLFGMTFLMYRWILGSSDKAEGPSEATTVKWDGPGAWKYPTISLAAGFLGGLLGLGGGVVMSPVLLEIGMHAEQVQATTAMFVLVSSSLATMQYAILGAYGSSVFWYCALCLTGTLAGQYFCEVFVRRRRRFSLITFAVTAILCTSFVSLVCIGVYQVWTEYSAGNTDAFLFHFPKVCGEHDNGIIMPYETDSFESWGVRKPWIPTRELPVPHVPQIPR